MKKKLIVINGTMGVGKSTICKELYKSIDNSVWLDGDWCWMMNPFVVTEEGKEMVIDNIQHLLNNFLLNSQHEVVIFCWVMHHQEIFDSIIERLNKCEYDLHWFTLKCSKEALIDRMKGDNRTENGIEKSVGYSEELFNNLDSEKIDTSRMSIEEVVNEIKNRIL